MDESNNELFEKSDEENEHKTRSSRRRNQERHPQKTAQVQEKNQEKHEKKNTKTRKKKDKEYQVQKSCCIESKLDVPIKAVTKYKLSSS